MSQVPPDDATDGATRRLRARIAADGPLAVSAYLEEALYGPDGFYVRGGRAGRRGDFLTAPEVGPLFGAVVARAVDRRWVELGSPATFTVLEWGAGPGTLARAVLAAKPRVLESGALRWVLIERSAPQRRQHPDHPQVRSVADWDEPPVAAGIVLANELLDNLPFDVHERLGDGWAPVLVTNDEEAPDAFATVLGPVADPPAALARAAVAPGTRLPLQDEARRWLDRARRSVERGCVLVFDYGGSTSELADRAGGWLRTHRGHDGTADWLRAPGGCDITADVDFDQLQFECRADRRDLQAEWLVHHGLDELVDEGRALWARSAGVGDLAALRARSRVREAEALTDPDGMGRFHVLEWRVGPPPATGK